MNGKGIRLVSNLMSLVDLVDKDPYEIPNIRDVLRATQGPKYFTVIDLKEGYYRMEIEEEDKHKITFEIDGQVYEWNSMVMGYNNSHQILQRVMNKIFSDNKGKGVEVYIDDVVIHSREYEEHDRLVELVLKKFKDNYMTINQTKVKYKRKEVKLLGVTINGKEKKASKLKKNEALEYPSPRIVTEIRRFLGMTGWFANFIQNYAGKTGNLTEGLKGKGKI